MSDDTLNKVFKETVDQLHGSFSEKLEAARNHANTQASREKNFSEIHKHLAAAINDIVMRGRQGSQQPREFYEKELNFLLTKISTLIATVRDDAHKTLGVIAAYEDVLTHANGMQETFSNVLLRARDIQERAASGEIDKPRKVGTRPDKIKDIRNFVEHKGDS